MSGPGSLSNSMGGISYLQFPDDESDQRSTGNGDGNIRSRPEQDRISADHREPVPKYSVSGLANGSVGQPYSQIITPTGGTAPFQWSVDNGSIITGWRVGGSVPDGLTLDVNTGTISETPTGGGTWYFDGTVTDASGVTVDSGFLSIQINSGTPPGNPVPLLNQALVPTAVSPGSASFTLNVSGTAFVSGATVDFNHAPLATTFIDGEHLSAVVPAAKVATADGNGYRCESGSRRRALQRGVFPGGSGSADGQLRECCKFTAADLWAAGIGHCGLQ